jgi:SAM-dependent methyltransferase
VSYLEKLLSTLTWEDILEFFENRGSNPFDEITTRREDEDKFDEISGTLTSCVYEQIELPEIVSGERGVECCRYHPSPVKSVRLIFDKLEKRGIRFDEFVFVDIGSGLGRILLIASQYPFKKIVGVEMSEHLNRQAGRNIQQYQSRHAVIPEIETRCMNALDYELPDDNLLLYFWETFGKRSSEEFVRKLELHVLSSKRRVIATFLGKVFKKIQVSEQFRMLEAFRTNDNTLSGHEYFDVSIFETAAALIRQD